MRRRGGTGRSACFCWMIMRSSGWGCGTCWRPSGISRWWGRRGRPPRRWPGFRHCARKWRGRGWGLPQGAGGRWGRGMRQQEHAVWGLLLRSYGGCGALFDAIMAGAAGYVLKQIRGSDVVGAVRTVAAGGSLLDPQAASRVLARLRERAAAADPLAGLTGQERRILELIGEGLTNRQIG